MTRASIVAFRFASAFLLAAVSAPSLSAPTTSPVAPYGADAAAARAINDFYRERNGRPFWLGASAAPAHELLKLLGTSDLDSIDKEKFQLGSLLLAVREASRGDRAAVHRAERMLSAAFITYAQDLQRDPRVGVIYVDPELKPTPASPAALLRAAANAPSLTAYISNLEWMNPLYGKLRLALLGNPAVTEGARYLLSLNLQRARALPRTTGRYVIVNAANQRLYMYEGDKKVDEMKVVVGRPTAQTPLMNAYIRFAVLNPYWNVPADLVARLAPKVLKHGSAYLREQGYEVVADFARPESVDPATVDWAAVAAGKLPVQMRQLPGPANSMGRVKFMFPNSQGIWLHDTPTREHLEKDVRLESAGCIRLEDAWRLGSWLLKRPLSPTTEEPERRLELSHAVPVFITYLTAVPQGSFVSYVNDPYDRDVPAFRAPLTLQREDPNGHSQRALGAN